ncbi:MAG TPA: TadA family conjugal transfer-associated ATPase [Marmoricola sp.]|nr:TadA family conjugal transfer-associated ATPase [Marmoricola sp.]
MSSIVHEDAVVAEVRDRLVRSGSTVTPESVALALQSIGRPLGDRDVLEVHDALLRGSRGAGPLEDLLQLDGVTDVLVNGSDQVWFDRGRGLERHELSFPDDAAVRKLAQRLAASVGRRLDDAVPYADLRLADGTRFHAVLAPLSRPGTTISLRVPQKRAMTMDELRASGVIGLEGAQLLRRVISSRCAFLVCGGTGSGKTTLLDSLLSEVDRDERIVIVEDSGELRPDHPHVVALESRQANIEGAGAVSMSVLVRQALRMRPDRLVVGEVRGAEIVDLLAALNTGHEGGCGTIHANSPAAFPARVEALALAAGMSRAAAQAQLLSAVDVVVHMKRERARRYVSEFGVIERDPVDGVRVSSAVIFDGTSVLEGPGAQRLVELLG